MRDLDRNEAHAGSPNKSGQDQEESVLSGRIMSSLRPSRLMAFVLDVSLPGTSPARTTVVIMLHDSCSFEPVSKCIRVLTCACGACGTIDICVVAVTICVLK